MWVGLLAVVVVGVLGLRKIERWHGTSLATELLVAFSIYGMLLGLCAGAVPKIQRAAERIRAERDAKQKIAPEPAGAETK
jgi:hypothetical protein